MEDDGLFSDVHETVLVCVGCSRWCFPSIVWQFSSTPNVVASFCTKFPPEDEALKLAPFEGVFDGESLKEKGEMRDSNIDYIAPKA